MGMSVDAQLIFGFAVGEGGEPPKWLLDPENPDAQAMEFDDFVLMHSDIPANTEWSVQTAFVDTCPARMFVHCYGDYPMYILGIRGMDVKAYSGKPKEIASLEVPMIKRDLFKAWCEEHNIPYEEPKWLLCSYWSN